MFCFAKSSTTVKQLATTQQNRLLLFSYKKPWSPTDRRMVSSRHENGLPDFGYKLHSYPQAISTHGLLFYNGYIIRNSSLQLAKRIYLIFLQIHIAETIGRMVSRLT
ncbi:hypothetical protein QL285_045943 [Trifolium repens]|nr:hypothetical protein QL285_045866 [Trifolium repens]KAK2410586.1 hypothetical protein QL285_045943 [Trifolium repens]